ncbi:MAG: hypothetical protein ACREMH_10105 [Gemmatimonadales bacterium]
MGHTRAVTRVATVVESFMVSGDTINATVVHYADRILSDDQGQPHQRENGVRHEEQLVHQGGEWFITLLRERLQLYLRRDGVPIQ